MATFGGKQPGYADPTMKHETDLITACNETFTFAGKQPGYADPVIIGCVPKEK